MLAVPDLFQDEAYNIMLMEEAKSWYGRKVGPPIDEDVVWTQWVGTKVQVPAAGDPDVEAGGEWGDWYTLLAATVVFRVRVLVVSSDRDRADHLFSPNAAIAPQHLPADFPRDDADLPIVNLGHLFGLHYVALMPIARQPLPALLPVARQPLPALSPELAARVAGAIAQNVGGRNDILVEESFSTYGTAEIPLDRSSMRRLRPGEGEEYMLNDSVVTFFACLVARHMHVQRGVQVVPPIHVFNTYFYGRLMRDGYSYEAVKRWTARNLSYCILDCEKIFVPIHPNSNHWLFVVIYPAQKRLECVRPHTQSSRASPRPCCCDALLCFEGGAFVCLRVCVQVLRFDAGCEPHV